MPDRALLPPSLIEEMPPPSPELALMGAILRAHMMNLSPKKRQAFLRAVMQVFTEYETGEVVVRLRAAKYDAEVTAARRSALAWVRGWMTTLSMTEIPPRR